MHSSRMARVVALTSLVAAPHALIAQREVRPVATHPSDTTGAPFFRSQDITLIAAAVVLSGEVSQRDTKIAHYFRSSSVQGGDSTLVKRLTKVNESTLTAAALLGYGVGRLTHSATLTDVSAHVGESVLLTSIVSQAIRGPFGRARPYVTKDDNNSDFHVGKGFTSYDYRSLPSLHSASAFAVASALTTEMSERNVGARWIVGPLLYGAATIPGLTRMYLDQHWASDVVLGAFTGAFLGAKVVHHAHANRRNRLDRFLLGASVLPDGRGGAALSWNLPLAH